MNPFFSPYSQQIPAIYFSYLDNKQREAHVAAVCNDEGIKCFYCYALFYFLFFFPSYSLENKSDPQAKPAPRQEIHTKETALGFTVTTVITYRDTEPPITRLLRRVKSYFYPDDSPPSEN